MLLSAKQILWECTTGLFKLTWLTFHISYFVYIFKLNGGFPKIAPLPDFEKPGDAYVSIMVLARQLSLYVHWAVLHPMTRKDEFGVELGHYPWFVKVFSGVVGISNSFFFLAGKYVWQKQISFILKGTLKSLLNPQKLESK